ASSSARPSVEDRGDRPGRGRPGEAQLGDHGRTAGGDGLHPPELALVIVDVTGDEMVPPGAGLPPVAEHSAHGVAATAPGERGGGVVATLHLGGLVVVSGEERGHAGLPEAGQPGEDGLRWTRRSGSSGTSPHRKSRTCACFEHTFESLSRQARLASPRTLRPCAEPSSTPDDRGGRALPAGSRCTT